MPDEITWSVWRPDWVTLGWIVWLVFFFVWETITILRGQQEALTHHLRPLFLEHPLTWWLGLGVWLWLGVHFLAPALEVALLEMVRGDGS